MMYREDSFFTLTSAGQIGLAVLSVLLAVCLFLFARALFITCAVRGGFRSWGIRVSISLALYWSFLWLSPQLYYLYYQAIIEGLPWQIVVQTPPSPVDAMTTLAFSGSNTLSEHSKALLGWGLLIYGIVARPAAR